MLGHGESFDIHGGGNDLMFPHHENEIAQSCCAHPEGQFARYWLHNEMLQVEGKKMSKSLGNFFTVRDLLNQGIPGEVIRFVFLSTHYRNADASGLKTALNFLGINLPDSAYWADVPKAENDLLDAISLKFSDLRNEAMRTKDFSLIDALRSKLQVAGVDVRMSKEGVELVPGPDFNPAKLEALK